MSASELLGAALVCLAGYASWRITFWLPSTSLFTRRSLCLRRLYNADDGGIGVSLVFALLWSLFLLLLIGFVE